VNSFPFDRPIYLYHSTSDDVFRNLAREEFLFDHLPEGSKALLLYVDSPAIVFGKHQNPWRECSLAVLRERGIPIARRISGGGTVYHDLGNLNFSFVLPKEGFNRHKNLTYVAAALGRLGVEAEINDRYDIYAGGKKVSGNAFCFRRERALHHGTLLVRSKLKDLRGALVGMKGIETFAVESRPAQVVNLADIEPRVTLDAIAEALVEEVVTGWSGTEDVHGSAVYRIGDEQPDNEEVLELDHRNRSAGWLFDRTPRFTIELDPPDGTFGRRDEVDNTHRRLRLTVDKGRIESVTTEATAPGPDDLSSILTTSLEGLHFDSETIAQALERNPKLTRLTSWFRELGL